MWHLLNYSINAIKFIALILFYIVMSIWVILCRVAITDDDRVGLSWKEFLETLAIEFVESPKIVGYAITDKQQNLFSEDEFIIAKMSLDSEYIIYIPHYRRNLFFRLIDEGY